jgi:hypothetical protein
MKILLCIALVLNIFLFLSEGYVLSMVRKKVDILKYYTYLQNFLSMIVSVVSSVFIIIYLATDNTVPGFIRGLRYIATCGLLFASFMYIVFLSSNKENHFSSEDFNRLDYKKANLFLHYICPLVSLISFVIFENEIVATSSIWTALVAIPSCLYWVIYLVLTYAKIWEAPYNFTNSKKKNVVIEILSFISIPIVFILVSYILWNIS